MKKIVPIGALLLAVLTLASCYWRPNFNSGDLSLDVSGIAPKNVGDWVRVYLIADGLLFSTGGGVPFAAEISGEDYTDKTILIEGLPVGPTYKAMVGWGPVSGGLFQPQFYGETELFKIAPNADTAVTVMMNDYLYSGNYTSFSPDLMGPILDIVDNGSSVYVAQPTALYLISYDWSAPIWYRHDFYDLAADLDGFGVNSYQVNGLSQGTYFGIFSSTYLNSSNGISPFYGGDGWSFNIDFSAALGGSKDIQESSSFQISILGPEYFAYPVFFRRKNGLGGTYVLSSATGNPTGWYWVNLDVAGLTDMAVSNYNAYFAAAGGLFALPPAFLQDPNLSVHRIDLPAPFPVQSLGFRPSGVAAGGTLSLGTSNGVWQAVVNESSGVTVTSGPTQVAETAGDAIERIAIHRNSFYGNAEAYLSRYYLYIRTTYGVDKIPFYAVVPGRATGMAWASDGTLYISGTEGLAAIAVSAYWGGSGI
jgi:hypothetical protein